jgi:hypothetical protein
LGEPSVIFLGTEGSRSSTAIKKEPQAGSYDQIDVEAGVLEADRDIIPLNQQSVARLRCAPKVELDHHARAGNTIYGNPPTHDIMAFYQV